MKKYFKIFIIIFSVLTLVVASIIIYIYATLGSGDSGVVSYLVGGTYESKNVMVKFNYIEYESEMTSFYYIIENKSKEDFKLDSINIKANDKYGRLISEYEYNIIIDGKNHNEVDALNTSIVKIVINTSFKEYENENINIDIMIEGISFTVYKYAIGDPNYGNHYPVN